jgi:hypothetical protein
MEKKKTTKIRALTQLSPEASQLALTLARRLLTDGISLTGGCVALKQALMLEAIEELKEVKKAGIKLRISRPWASKIFNQLKGNRLLDLGPESRYAACRSDAKL